MVVLPTYNPLGHFQPQVTQLLDDTRQVISNSGFINLLWALVLILGIKVIGCLFVAYWYSLFENRVNSKHKNLVLSKGIAMNCI